MIDYDLLIVSVSGLLFVVVIGGTILLYPLTRKLGHLLDSRAAAPRDVAPTDDGASRRLAARLEALEDQLAKLAEQQAALADRQEFVDRLLMEQRPARSLGGQGEGD
jgi:hypothetical protein